jgi:hypothetical protein
MVIITQIVGLFLTGLSTEMGRNFAVLPYPGKMALSAYGQEQGARAKWIHSST